MVSPDGFPPTHTQRLPGSLHQNCPSFCWMGKTSLTGLRLDLGLALSFRRRQKPVSQALARLPFPSVLQ